MNWCKGKTSFSFWGLGLVWLGLRSGDIPRELVVVNIDPAEWGQSWNAAGRPTSRAFLRKDLSLCSYRKLFVILPFLYSGIISHFSLNIIGWSLLGHGPKKPRGKQCLMWSQILCTEDSQTCGAATSGSLYQREQRAFSSLFPFFLSSLSSILLFLFLLLSSLPFLSFHFLKKKKKKGNIFTWS